MYHKIGIQKLSPAQTSKFLNGHAITVKHGSHHEVPVSVEQHKKIHAAHKRGKGVRITADPYQRDMCRSQGIFESFKKVYNYIKPHTERVYHQNKETIHKVGKDLGHQAISCAHDYLSEPVHSRFGETGKNLLNAAAHIGHTKLGHGIKRRGRPRKHHAVHHKHHGSHGEGPFEDVFTKTIPGIAKPIGETFKPVVGFNPYDEGYKFGYETLGPAIFGKGIKRRGRKPRGGSLSGGALMPAGYGEGARGRKGGRRGKVPIGDLIGSHIPF